MNSGYDVDKMARNGTRVDRTHAKTVRQDDAADELGWACPLQQVKGWVGGAIGVRPQGRCLQMVEDLAIRLRYLHFILEVPEEQSPPQMWQRFDPDADVLRAVSSRKLTQS